MRLLLEDTYFASLYMYVFSSLRLFPMMPLSSLWNKHHVDSPFLTVHVEGPEIPSSGSDGDLTRQDSRDHCPHSSPPTRPHPLL